MQWSFTGACPPSLSETSAAFRRGGFGTHENVLYYELVRHLVESCWDRVGEPADPAAEKGTAPVCRNGPKAGTDAKRWSSHKGGLSPKPSPDELAAWLRGVQETWLGEPDWEDLSGRTPAEVIRMERQRIPMTATHDEALIDEDCPLCQMAADGPGPMFWHLDGCNMDQDFPFSIYCADPAGVGGGTTRVRGVRSQIRGTGACRRERLAGRLAGQRAGRRGIALDPQLFRSLGERRAMDQVVRDRRPPGGANPGTEDFAGHGRFGQAAGAPFRQPAVRGRRSVRRAAGTGHRAVRPATGRADRSATGPGG